MTKVDLRWTVLPLQQCSSSFVLKYAATYTRNGCGDAIVAPSPTATPFLMLPPALAPSGLVTDMISAEFPHKQNA